VHYLFNETKTKSTIMKKRINFSSKMLQSLFVAGSMFLAVSCSENRTADSTNDGDMDGVERIGDADDLNNENTAVVIENDNDAKFLMDIAEMQLEEINLGRLAQERATAPHVKELGSMMVQDHTKTLSEIQALAQSKSVTIPSTLENDDIDGYDKIEDKTGNDFDKEYTDLMVKHHKDAIDKFEKIANDGEDSEIKAWATQKLPTLRNHLEHAEAAKEKSDNMES
jgi:putative membrane protein